MDMNEFAERLAMLEGANEDRMMQEQQRGFMDKYGTMFSGDEGIGMAILGEMSRRGIDAAAVGADRVINEILDAIRMEATAILDKIKQDRDTVNALVQQVQEIQGAVDAAVGGEGQPPIDGVLDLPPPAEGALPPEAMGGDMGIPPPEGDMGLPPPDMGGASMGPPPGMDMGAPPMAGDMGPPMEDGMPPPGEEPPIPPGPPPPIMSDEKVKRIVRKKPAPKAAEPKGWKPPASMLAAIQGGL